MLHVVRVRVFDGQGEVAGQELEKVVIRSDKPHISGQAQDKYALQPAVKKQGKIYDATRIRAQKVFLLDDIAFIGTAQVYDQFALLGDAAAEPRCAQYDDLRTQQGRSPIFVRRENGHGRLADAVLNEGESPELETGRQKVPASPQDIAKLQGAMEYGNAQIAGFGPQCAGFRHRRPGFK